MGVSKYDDDVMNDALLRLMDVNNNRLNNPSDCQILDHVFLHDRYSTSLPDISALNVFSDGRYLNYTAWFYPGFKNHLVVTNDSSSFRLPLMSIDIESLENNNSSLKKYVDNIITNIKENGIGFRLVERVDNLFISDHPTVKIVYNVTNIFTKQDSQTTK